MVSIVEAYDESSHRPDIHHIPIMIVRRAGVFSV